MSEGMLHELVRVRAALSPERRAEFDASIRNLILDFTPIDPSTLTGVRIEIRRAESVTGEATDAV